MFCSNRGNVSSFWKCTHSRCYHKFPLQPEIFTDCRWSKFKKCKVLKQDYAKISEKESRQLYLIWSPFFSEDNPPPKTPESEKNYLPKIPRKCCTIQEVKDRPEIILWYFANMISYLGFFMPFLNLVSLYNSRIALLNCYLWKILVVLFSSEP